MSTTRDEQARERPYDLLIIGAGTAGMSCAITAAEAGARVCVLEKSSAIGGTLQVSAGQMSGAGFRRQAARGIEDSLQCHFDDVMRISKGLADPVIVALAVAEAPQTIDWLENLGFPFDPATPAIMYGHEAYSVPRTVWGVNGGRSILETIRPLWDAAVAAGGIDVRLGHAVTGLVTGDGRVLGARTGSGRDARDWLAPATVLTTGGYAANPDMFAALTGDAPLVSAARPTSTGEGIAMAARIGAQVRGGELYVPVCGGIENPPGSGRADWWTAWVNLRPDRDVRELFVNRAGTRFIAEDDESPDRLEQATMRQPDHAFWVVFDDSALGASTPVFQWDAEQFRSMAEQGELAWVADTPADLARLAGIDPDGLVRTVRSWDDAVRTGHDPVGRRGFAPVLGPRFYAVRCRGTSLSTFAGVKVDGQLRVLDAADQPIKGLYAAGEAIGGGSTCGNAFAGGMMVTPALSFGRVLGRMLSATAAVTGR